MKIKICGLFRDEDIEYTNEAKPDFAGFVFAASRRQVNGAKAARLRKKLLPGIVPVGVFVDAALQDIVSLYKDGVIEMAQLHGNEDDCYIAELKGLCGVPVIKTVKVRDKSLELRDESLEAIGERKKNENGKCGIDYVLFDSGAGTGAKFDWTVLEDHYSLLTTHYSLNWILAGGINLDNIKEAMSFNPFAIDVSSGAETNGFKNREKMLELVKIVHGI